jgi:hypothetical protein
VGERTIILTAGPREAHYWAISGDAEATGRYVRQTSCPGHFAVVTLRLEIEFGPDAVIFVSRLDEQSVVWLVATDDAGKASPTAVAYWNPYVSEVAEGVKEGLTGLSPDEKPIQAVKVSLLGLKVHPIDSRAPDFRRAAVIAVTEAVHKVGLVEGPT